MQIGDRQIQDYGADKKEGTGLIKKTENHDHTEKADFPTRGQSSVCRHTQVSGSHVRQGAVLEGALSVCNAEGCEVGDTVPEAH